PPAPTPQISTLPLHDALPISPPVNQDVPASLRYLWRLYIDPYNFYTLHVHPTGRPYLAVVSAGNEANTYSPSDPVLQAGVTYRRSEEHTSELQSRENLVCRLL